MTAEDETAIKKLVHYDQKTDRLIGFCGKEEEEHTCDAQLELKVGDDYEQLLQMFKDHHIGGYARVIMLNPLHPSLPCMPVYLQCSCNRFNTQHVKQQWDELERLYADSGLSNVLGPLIGKQMHQSVKQN